MHDSIPLINSACGYLLHLTGSLNHAASSLKKETTPHPNHSSRRPQLLSSLSRRLGLNLTRVHCTVAPPGGGSVEFSPITGGGVPSQLPAAESPWGAWVSSTAGTACVTNWTVRASRASAAPLRWAAEPRKPLARRPRCIAGARTCASATRPRAGRRTSRATMRRARCLVGTLGLATRNSPATLGNSSVSAHASVEVARLQPRLPSPSAPQPPCAHPRLPPPRRPRWQPCGGALLTVPPAALFPWQIWARAGPRRTHGGGGQSGAPRRGVDGHLQALMAALSLWCRGGLLPWQM
jgi:hypothetical protein